ncbi:MAG: hypothetical protein ACRDD1_17780, partial [Planctomycetia bacterium]
CSFLDRSTVTMDAVVRSDALMGMAGLLRRLLPTDALRLEKAGDLAGAAERYTTILRGGRHYAHEGPLIHYLFGLACESLVLDRLLEWAWRDGQTPELVHAMIGELESAGGLYERYIAALETEWLLQRRLTPVDVSRLLEGPSFDERRRSFQLLLLWEDARWRRIVDLAVADEIDQALRAGRRWEPETPIADRLRLTPPSGYTLNEEDVDRWKRTTPLVAEYGDAIASTRQATIRALARRRLALAFLAVREYQLRHGRPPATLEELVGKELARPPIDPWGDGAALVLYPPAGLPTATSFRLPDDSPLYDAPERIVVLPAGARYVATRPPILDPQQAPPIPGDPLTTEDLLPIDRPSHEAKLPR